MLDKFCLYVVFLSDHGYFSAPNILETLFKSCMNYACCHLWNYSEHVVFSLLRC